MTARSTPLRLTVVAACLFAIPAAAPGAPAVAQTAQALTLTAAVDRTTRATAEAFTLTAATDDGLADAYELKVEWGDGTAETQVEEILCERGGQSGELHRRVALRKAYRYPGTYQVRVTATSDGCTAPTESRQRTLSLTVQAGAEVSNGPEQPRLTVGDPGIDRRDVTLLPDVDDRDGQIARLIVEWGDGRREVRPGRACTDPAGHWPDDFDAYVLTHRYAAAGRYRPTVTVVSAGCDGRDLQSASRTYRIRL